MKGQFQTKLESQMNRQQLWQGLQAITTHKLKPGNISGHNILFPYERTALLAIFESENIDTPTRAPTDTANL